MTKNKNKTFGTGKLKVARVLPSAFHVYFRSDIIFGDYDKASEKVSIAIIE